MTRGACSHGSASNDFSCSMITRHLRFGLVEVLLALACFVSLGILISARSLQSVAINQSIAINKSVANNQSVTFSLSQLVCSYYTQAN